jgi:putative glutamine amidotransferase
MKHARHLILIVMGVLLMAAAYGESRPVIGINMAVPDQEKTRLTTLSIQSAYVDSVLAAGGTPIIVPPLLDLEMVEVYAELVDGFVFVGGPDINPARFGQEPHEAWKAINPRREEFDFAYMKAALETGKPVLGVCLGMQMLNVSQGGEMIQDIPALVETEINHRPDQPGTELAHDVRIREGSRLHEILGVKTLYVNSLHHQACIVKPETGVVVSALSPDGVIEAIELPAHPFAIGVQWHPEYLTDAGAHLSIFEALVKKAAEAKEQVGEREVVGVGEE